MTTLLVPFLALTALAAGPPHVSSVASAAPSAIIIATSRGVAEVPVATHHGHPALPMDPLEQLLPVSGAVEGGWATIGFAGEPFRFLLGAPVLVHRNRVVPLVGGAYVTRDTLFVPLQWLAEYVPSLFSEGYRYDPIAGRFEEARVADARAAPPPRPAFTPPSAAARERGFRMQHLVVVDAGHGGDDPGNPGRYLPPGVQEKHVTLAIAHLLRDELVRRGVDVLMTRDADTLIALADRAPMCRDECDLFVSIHVNSLPRPTERVSGVETYFLGEARTAEARRVAAMENEALRYESTSLAEHDNILEFIFKDLHTNEFLRESAQLADLVQARAARVHPGGDRGVAQNDRFVVLNMARRPAVLVETGFATSRRDARFLASRNGQRRLAIALADGIEEYLKRFERKVLFGTDP